MYSELASLGLTGIEPYAVRVEVDINRGLPAFDIVGLPDVAVRESRDRVRSALQNLGYKMPQARIVVNLAPADTRKQGSVYDLPILLSLLQAAGYEQFDFTGTAVIGEIGLSGELRPVTGVLPMVLDAGRMGIQRVIVPIQNAGEAAVAEKDIEVLCATHSKEVIACLSGRGELQPAREVPHRVREKEVLPDLADVKGHSEARRALEIAAAGNHSLLMIGPPGTGKSMLARRLPSILPPMTRAEAIEATKIHSAAGLLGQQATLLRNRPFRTPHHTASPVALTGGGPLARPGDVSLAHNGVLFLDELPEFQKTALEVLRQPLEDAQVSISRVRQRVSYPSRVMLVAAMNPCPCGYFGHPTRSCICAPAAMQRYLNRVSGPLLDRIDLHIEVLPVSYEQLSGRHSPEDSKTVRERVCAARERQLKRFEGTSVTCNADIPPSMLDESCAAAPEAMELLQTAFDRMGLSARGYGRILKVARTIADLDASAGIEKTHIAQAVQLRSLDRKYWGV